MTKKLGRGRPSFKVTPTIRNQVAIAAGAGMSHEDIALSLGTSRNTLEKYFEIELSIGAHKKRLEVVIALHRAAKKGNVAAAKAYTAALPRISAPPLESPGPEGKKAQANEAAKVAQVGTEWDSLLKPTNPLQ